MDSINNHFKDILPWKGHRHLLPSLYPSNQTLTLFSTLHTGGPSYNYKPHTLLHTAPPIIASSLLHLHARLSAGINGPSPTGIGFAVDVTNQHTSLLAAMKSTTKQLFTASCHPPGRNTSHPYCRRRCHCHSTSTAFSHSRYVSSLFDV